MSTQMALNESPSADRVQRFTRRAPRTLYSFGTMLSGRSLAVRGAVGGPRALPGSGCGTRDDLYVPGGPGLRRPSARLRASRSSCSPVELRVRDFRLPARCWRMHAPPGSIHKYDCVYSLGLLEHFDDPVAVMREMPRVLKPAAGSMPWWCRSVFASAPFLAYGLFAPWRLVPHMAPPAVRHAAKLICAGESQKRRYRCALGSPPTITSGCSPLSR